MNKQCWLTYIIVLSNSIIALGQAPSWQWAKSNGGGTANNVQGASISVDANGNSYITGKFNGTAVSFDGISLPDANNNDIFIVKYDASGNAQWAKSPQGDSNEESFGISVDANGNSYVTGRFYSDSIVFDNISLMNAGMADMFIAKYDISGNALWAKSAGDTMHDVGLSISADVYGNAYVTGTYSGPSVVFGNDTLTNSGSGHIFIAKYDSSGNLLRVKMDGGIYSYSVRSISTDGYGNATITGIYFGDSISFGSVYLTDTIPSLNALFIARYDSSGNLLWAKSVSGIESVESIHSDANGNSYVTGYYGGMNVVMGNDTLINIGARDIFIAKYDSTGNVLWAKCYGGNYYDYGHGISMDVNENLYVTGIFFDTIAFDSDTLFSSGGGDIFVTKFDALGNVVWAKKAGGTYNDRSYSVGVDANGNAYITGYFYGPSIYFENIVLNGDFNNTFLVAKLNTTTGIGEYENDSYNAINIFPNPVTDKLNIMINNNDLSEIILYDITSRKLLQQKFTNSVSLNTEQLAKGIYLYELRNKNDVIKKGKIVKD